VWEMAAERLVFSIKEEMLASVPLHKGEPFARPVVLALTHFVHILFL